MIWPFRRKEIWSVSLAKNGEFASWDSKLLYWVVLNPQIEHFATFKEAMDHVRYVVKTLQEDDDIKHEWKEDLGYASRNPGTTYWFEKRTGLGILLKWSPL